MTTFHCSIKKGKTGNAKLHCDYINREGRYANGKIKEELVYKEAGNLPSWAKTGSEFFECADLYERKNGNAYMEFEVALPNELSLDDNIKLVKDFVNKNIGDNKVYAFAIHQKKASLDNTQDQPHAHIMFSEKIITDKKHCKPSYKFFKQFYRKKPELSGYEKDDRFFRTPHDSAVAFKKVRESWANHINEAYAAKGLDLEVSHLSLAEQKRNLENVILNQETEMTEKQWQNYVNVNKPPQKHLGPKLTHQMKKDIKKPGMTFDLMSPKARLYMMNKEIQNMNLRIKEDMQLLARVNKEKERFTNTFNDLQQQLKEFKKYGSSKSEKVEKETLIVNGNELIQRMNQSASELSKLIRENNKKLMELENDILTDDRIEKVAYSIYTKGKTKEYKDTLRKLERERGKFENEFKTFSELPLPKMNDVQEQKKYYELKGKLDKWQTDLLSRETSTRKNQEILLNELAKPEHKENIQKIIEVLTRSNEEKLKTFNSLQAENKELKALGRKVMQVNRTINGKVKYVIDKSLANNIGTPIENRNTNPLDNAINKLKHAVDSSQSIKGNNMKVNFHDHTKGDDGYDMGI